jgi:hypothetical protein
VFQPQTQTREYWEQNFSLTEQDIEQLYNHFIEVGKPQTSAEVTRAVMEHRVSAEKQTLRRRIRGRKVYQPRDTFAVGDEIVFPHFDFAETTVNELRKGNNPESGEFEVITVKLRGRQRQFATGLPVDHIANLGENGVEDLLASFDSSELFAEYGEVVEPRIIDVLEGREEFIVLGGRWFVHALLADVNIGHLHLAEAVLDMSGGGPLTTDEISNFLDLDQSIPLETRMFSLNTAMLEDPRFDEVAPKNSVAWFLKRVEPETVLVTPERLRFDPVPFDEDFLTAQLKLTRREIADEWSDLPIRDGAITSATFTLIYPHRVTGTMPINTTIRKLLPLGRSPRQLLTFQNETTGEQLQIWAIKKGRYLYGFSDWYTQNEVLVGAYITLKRVPDSNVILFDYVHRNRRTDDVRLATVADGRIKFEFQRRRIACEYDDLMVVGTDYTAAIDAIFERAKTRSLASLIAALLPELAVLSPQQAVHAKTLYAVTNMLRRVAPDPLFAELVANPAFIPIGEHYWRFDPRRYRRS